MSEKISINSSGPYCSDSHLINLIRKLVIAFETSRKGYSVETYNVFFTAAIPKRAILYFKNQYIGLFEDLKIITSLYFDANVENYLLSQ